MMQTTAPKVMPMEVTKETKAKPAAAEDLTPMSDIKPIKTVNPAGALGVKVPKKKQQISRKQRMRKEKAADKGEAVRERLTLKVAKQSSRKEEKDKWKTLY